MTWIVFIGAITVKTRVQGVTLGHEIRHVLRLLISCTISRTFLKFGDVNLTRSWTLRAWKYDHVASIKLFRPILRQCETHLSSCPCRPCSRNSSQIYESLFLAQMTPGGARYGFHRNGADSGTKSGSKLWDEFDYADLMYSD